MAENQAETMSCYPMQFPDMVAKKKTIRCALKFKVTTKGIWNVSEDKLCEGTDGPCTVKPSKRKPEMSLDDQSWKKQKMGPFKVKSCEGTDRQRNRVSVGVSKPPEANVPVKPLMPVTSGKRKPEMSFDDQRWKKQKMDCSSKLECSKILKDLMNHSVGWAFSEPVDPVKLKIPDYFQIIRNPMDLGTIKHKLERDKYSAAKEFADDVQLTFKNAMSYNPPEDEVHRWAEILDGTFKRKWKLLDARLKHTNKIDEKTRKVLEDNHQVMKLINHVYNCTGHCNRRAPASTNLGQSIDSKLDCEVKCTSTSLANSFALDSEGRGVAYNEDKSPCSTSATTPAFVEGWMADVPMSPKKALRVAMLKSRFADTIFKATHPTLVDNDEKSDPSRIQQERLQLEKEQLKEKARIEAQIKAAEAASRRKQQDELKMRRERERKAARIALEKMEKTVEIDWALSMLRDLDILFGGYPNSKSVEQLGLYLKEKYVEEDDAEDGEIL